MILEVVKYGHPVLRKKGARIENVTPALHQFIADMFETMYASHGIGLAAQQVGEALQLELHVRMVADVDGESVFRTDGFFLNVGFDRPVIDAAGTIPQPTWPNFNVGQTPLPGQTTSGFGQINTVGGGAGARLARRLEFRRKTPPGRQRSRLHALSRHALLRALDLGSGQNDGRQKAHFAERADRQDRGSEVAS